MTTITATFTADPIIQPLKFFLDLINVESEINLAPYAQVFQQLLDPHSLFYTNERDINILLIRLEDWLPSKSANQLSENNNSSVYYLNGKVEKFLSVLKSATDKMKAPLIITLCRPSPAIYENDFMKENFIKLKEKLQKFITQCIGIYLISTETIEDYYPVQDYYNNYSNKIGHIPYTESYFLALAATLVRKIHAIFYPTHKVIVLDCDNTLWEGICGEVEDINDLKITETQQALQRFIIEQQKIGMLICLCSKNNEMDVWSVFDRHPAMLLKRHHLAFYQINWQEKAINISEIAKQLNLSLNSFVFIDDKTHECRAMQSAHPEVLTIQYKENIIHILQHIWCLDRLTITQEDRQRTSAYQKKNQKLASSSNISSLDQFIKDLQLEVSLLPLFANNPSEIEYLKRAAELTRKVNQFNCTTQRLTDKQLQQLLTHSKKGLVIYIRDKEKIYGLKGVLIYEIKEGMLEVSNFLLSCDVLGCGAEHYTLNELGHLAKVHNVSLIKFLFIPNDRNEPAELFLTSVCGPAVKADDSLFFNISLEKACSVSYEMTRKFILAKKDKEISEKNRTEKETEKPTAQQKNCIDYLRIAHDFSTVEKILYNLKNMNSRSFFTDSVFIAAKTPLEKQLLGLWQESLNISNLSCADNFTQLGGDSIKATLVLAKLYSIYNTELQISDVLNSTVSKLANFIEEKEKKLNLPQQIKLQRGEGCLFPLSFAQQRLWFLDQLEPNTPLYNMFVAFELKGSVNKALLKQTFLILLERHESLRTCFIKRDGKAYQSVLAYSPNLLQFSWDVTLGLSEQVLAELAHKEAQQVFELDNGSLLRIRMLENEDQYTLMICMHHIIHDGWSFHIFCQELTEIYSALVENRPINLTQKKLDYIDFSHWQHELLSITRQDHLLNYWTKQLADFIPTKLPSDYAQLNNRCYTGDRIPFSISKETLASIKKLSQTSQTTLFTTLFSVFSILISHYIAQKDLVIGTPISGRHYPNLENMIGFFVNILILRTDLHDNPSFQVFLHKNKEMIFDAYQHQDLPFEKVISALNPGRRKGENPLANIMFIFQNYPVTSLQLPGLSCKRIFSDNESLLLADYESAKVDLSLYVQETTEGLQALFEYNTQLFHRLTIERLITHFHRLLQIITQTPLLAISEMTLLDKKESDQLSAGLGATKKDYPIHIPLCTLLEQQFAKMPNRTALSFAGQTLSYKQLNETANQLASHWLDLGLQRQQTVGIYLNKNFKLMISLLALWKVGAIPVFIDPNYPKGRVQFIVNDCQASWLLTQEKLHNNLKTKLNLYNESDGLNKQISILDLDQEWILVSKKAKNNLTRVNSLNDAVYIIYTSGSTGHPKGVLIGQQGIINMAYAQIDALGIHADDRILQFSRFTFDAFFWDTLGAWLAGAELCLVASEIKLGDDLLQTLKSERITIATLTPSVVETIPEGMDLPYLRYLVLAGEEASLSLVEKWSQHCQVINAYGPTEASVCASLEKVNLSIGKLGIGKPLANVEIYILDTHHQLVPSSASGEIYIGGAGIALGYLNQPELTKKSFLQISLNGKTKQLYKTGDRGRWLVDGRLEYLGRIENDEQIKLRGLRIQKEEIKQQLLKHTAIANAAVIVTEQHLVAYLVIKPSVFSEKNSYFLNAEDQTQQWQKLYEELYQQLDTTQPVNFDCLGWNSSYTKKPFLEAEMEEWIDTTVQRILTLKPKRVLEIGCGAGLLMARIAGDCDFYRATDFSAAAINYLEKLTNTLGLQERVYLLQRSADCFFENEKESYDLIIINSVIQYFPDIEYFILVIERAIACLQPGGKLFIGDIRSLTHLEMFHHRLMWQQDTMNIQTLAIELAESIDCEEELLIQADFFDKFAQKHALLDCAITQLRRGQHINEMTQFRYDAIIYKKGPNLIPRLQINCLEWGTAFITEEDIKNHLVNQSPSYLAIQGIPNARLLSPEEKLDGITAQQLQNPETLFRLAEMFDYQASISWSKKDAVNAFDVIFYRGDRLVSIAAQPSAEKIQLKQENWLDYANQPQKNKIKQGVLVDLKRKIKEVIPEYMVPANWYFIKQIPLTSHGKIDEKLLRSLSLKRSNYTFSLPTTDIEKKLSALWKSCLNTDRLGTNTNFFEIGGESLRAVELITKINEDFSINLPIKTLIDAPTIKMLAPMIENQLKETKPTESLISAVVTLKKSSEGLPLFLIHPVGGTVFCYKDLIKNLTFAGSCYAIQDPSIVLKQILFSSIEEMATSYIKLIKNIQPKGPYKIAGHSFGGTVAVEIARQFQQSGEEVQLVALFDTWASTRNKDKINQQVEETLIKQYKAEKQKEYSAQFFQKEPTIDLSSWIELGQYRMNLSLNYQVPSDLTFPLILFKAKESVGKALNNQDSTTNYWDRYCPNIQINYVCGNHESMLRYPFVKNTATLFDRYLDVDCKPVQKNICSGK